MTASLKSHLQLMAFTQNLAKQRTVAGIPRGGRAMNNAGDFLVSRIEEGLPLPNIEVNSAEEITFSFLSGDEEQVVSFFEDGSSDYGEETE